MTLSGIITGPRVTPRRIMIYGVGGIGKSTFAAQAPKPIFIQTEEGLEDLARRGMNVDRFPICESLADVIAYIGELYTGTHDYQTVVVDSLDWLEALIHRKVCKEKGIESIDQIPWGKGFLVVQNHWRDVLEGLESLRRKRSMNVILIGHANVKRHESPIVSETYDRYSPKLDKRSAAMCIEWCEDVLFAIQKVSVRNVGDEMRKRYKGIDMGRVLYTSEQPGIVAKNRCGLPDEIPLSWNAYAEIAFASHGGAQPEPAAEAAEETEMNDE